MRLMREKEWERCNDKCGGQGALPAFSRDITQIRELSIFFWVHEPGRRIKGHKTDVFFLTPVNVWYKQGANLKIKKKPNSSSQFCPFYLWKKLLFLVIVLYLIFFGSERMLCCWMAYSARIPNLGVKFRQAQYMAYTMYQSHAAYMANTMYQSHAAYIRIMYGHII